MTATRDRNAVLLYFVLARINSQSSAIAASMRNVVKRFGPRSPPRFMISLSPAASRKPLSEPSEKIGDVLARYFPRQPDDRDELPNVIERD